ncbi:MAG: AAA-like domain-containing protein, partial [Blastocatellia bacterium]
MDTDNFYVAGGTLWPGAPSYVERQADRELYERALAGDFCYVLTSRQMGKSSLMARVAKRLKDEAGVHTAIIDLTNIGAEDESGSAEKWYYGVATGILDGLGLDVNLDDWWDERAKLPALQRLTKFFSEIALARTTNKVVI